jgi:hypothetical protein
MACQPKAKECCMTTNLSELDRYIHLTRSYILYMDEVLMSRSPAIDRELAGMIRGQLIQVIMALRLEKRSFLKGD